MEPGDLADRFADLVAYVFHPLFITWFLGFCFLYLADLKPETAVKWILLLGSITIVPMALFLRLHPDYTIRTRNGKKRRNLLYTIGLLELVVVGIVLHVFNGPEILKQGYAGAITAMVIGGLLNRYFTKVSVHVGIMSGFATATYFVSRTAGTALFGLTVLVGWARLRADKHTLEQVILGGFVPFFCLSASFLLF